MTKIQLLLYLTIGNLIAAVLWNYPVNAWNWDDLGEGVRNNINSLAAGSSQAQTPLPVPQMQAPIGNSASIQPCAAPPPTMAAKPPALKPVAPTIHVQKPVAPMVESTSPTTPTEIVTDRIEYNQGGSITQKQADHMSRFKKPQTYDAIRSLLGTPNYRDSNSDVYNIQGTSDGIIAPRRLVVFYELHIDDNFTTPKAVSWSQQ